MHHTATPCRRVAAASGTVMHGSLAPTHVWGQARRLWLRLARPGSIGHPLFCRTTMIANFYVFRSTATATTQKRLAMAAYGLAASCMPSAVPDR